MDSAEDAAPVGNDTPPPSESGALPSTEAPAAVTDVAEENDSAQERDPSFNKRTVTQTYVQVDDVPATRRACCGICVWPLRALVAGAFSALVFFVWPLLCTHVLRDNYCTAEDASSSLFCPFGNTPLEAPFAPAQFYPPPLRTPEEGRYNAFDGCTLYRVARLVTRGDGLVCEYGNRSVSRAPAYISRLCSTSMSWEMFPDNCQFVLYGRVEARFNGSSLWHTHTKEPYTPGPGVAAVVWFPVSESIFSSNKQVAAKSYVQQYIGQALPGILSHVAGACMPRGTLDHPSIVRLISAANSWFPRTSTVMQPAILNHYEALQYALTFLASSKLHGEPVLPTPARILYNALAVLLGLTVEPMAGAQTGPFREYDVRFESVITLTDLLGTRVVSKNTDPCWYPVW